MVSLNEKVLIAATQEAVRQGLIPEHASLDDYVANFEKIRAILKAANAADNTGGPG